MVSVYFIYRKTNIEHEESVLFLVGGLLGQEASYQKTGCETLKKVVFPK